MKKNGFANSFRILSVTLLALAVFVPKKYSQTAMAIAMALWLTIMIGGFLIRMIKNHKSKKQHIRPVKKTRTKERLLPPAPIAEELPITPPPKPVVTVDSETEQDLEMMMQHMSIRISEKLKSAYPDAVWKWCKKPSLEELLHGTTVRIKVEAMAQYTHADITFDRFGRIHVEPMKIGSFASPDISENTDPDEEQVTEPIVVDVRAWYELVGQKVLETQITELNATGHSKLVIKENGDIVINRQKKEILVTTLDAFPGKNYWNELVSILEENELNAKIAGNGLQVSWIM